MPTISNFIAKLFLITSSIMMCNSYTILFGNPIIPKAPNFSEFQKNVEKINFQFAPDGNHVSYLKNDGKQNQLYVVAFGGSEHIKIAAQLNGELTNYNWKDNDNLVIEKTVSATESHIYLVNLGQLPIKEISVAPGLFKNKLVDVQTKNKDEILISNNKRNTAEQDVYRINMSTNTSKLIVTNSVGITNWVCDNNGKLKIGYVTKGNKHLVYSRLNETDPMAVTLETDYKDAFYPLAFDESNNQIIYCASNEARNYYGIVKYNLKTKSEIAMLYDDPNNTFDVKEIILSPFDASLLGVTYNGITRTTEMLHPTLKLIVADLQKRSLGKRIEVLAVNNKMDRLLIKQYNEKTRGAIFIYESIGKNLLKICDISAPGILEEQLCVAQYIPLTTKSKTKINGYLTLPSFTKENLPTVLLLRNNLFQRDILEYNAEAQYLAARGYAVMQLNYSGSIGLGREVYANGFKNWDNAMTEDIQTAIDYLITNKIANAGQIALMGTGFGGYAALCAAANNNNINCVIDINGIIDLDFYSNSIQKQNKIFADIYKEAFGDPIKDSAMLRTISPIAKTASIKCPILVVSGGKETKNNPATVASFIAKLQQSNNSVTVLSKAEESTVFKSETNREELYTAIDDFLTKNMMKAKTSKLLVKQ
jgi:dipeptidyl aminopeptidase/acylaminoacyl peptidase